MTRLYLLIPLALAGCTEAEKSAGSSMLASFGVSDPVAMRAEVPKVAAAECVLVGAEWRLWTCETGVKTLIP